MSRAGGYVVLGWAWRGGLAGRFISAILILLALGGQAVAGWYHVENYQGSIGSHPIHLSLQTYDFGSGIMVEGSYFYDDRQSPIPLYGKLSGTGMVLCEISDEKQFQRILVIGSKTPIDTAGCALNLDVTTGGATGSWSQGTETYPVILTRVAGLDDTGEGKIDGSVEIPFWAQTANDRFAGIYTNTSAGICMTKMQVIRKHGAKVVQEITFRDDDVCSAGMLMTPIYMNVEKWIEHGKDVISVNFRGGGAGTTSDYIFDPAARKYRQRQ